MNIIYFHGFNSAPKKGEKYNDLKEVFNQEILMPSLDYTSDTLFEDVEEYLTELRGMNLVIGTSLGGYMAMHFAKKGLCEAWVFNPSINPQESLKVHLGEIRNYVTQEVYEWGLDNVKIFEKAMEDVADLELESNDIKVAVGTEDELLPPEKTVAFFKEQKIPVREYKDNHRFSNNFKKALNEIKSAHFMLASSL